MRAVTAEELEQIAIGLSEDSSWSAHPLVQPPLEPPVKVTGTYDPPPPISSPPSPPPPPSGGGGGGGSGESPAQAAASAAEAGLTFATAGMQDVDYSYIFKWENFDPLVVDVPSSNSGVTVGYGIDLSSKTTTQLQGDVLAGYLSQSLENTLAPMTGGTMTGTTAEDHLSTSGLDVYPNFSTSIGQAYELPSTTSTSSIQDFSESFYGEIMQSVNQDFANTTKNDGAGGAFAGVPDYATYLPPDTATALTDESIWWGQSGMENNLDSGVFWYDLTHYDWSAASASLETEAQQHYTKGSNGYNRLMGDAGLIDQDVGSGNLVNGLPSE